MPPFPLSVELGFGKTILSPIKYDLKTIRLDNDRNMVYNLTGTNHYT